MCKSQMTNYSSLFILSFYPVDTGTKHRLLGLAASTFTY